MNQFTKRNMCICLNRRCFNFYHLLLHDSGCCENIFSDNIKIFYTLRNDVCVGGWVRKFIG